MYLTADSHPCSICHNWNLTIFLVHKVYMYTWPYSIQCRVMGWHCIQYIFVFRGHGRIQYRWKKLQIAFPFNFSDLGWLKQTIPAPRFIRTWISHTWVHLDVDSCTQVNLGACASEPKWTRVHLGAAPLQLSWHVLNESACNLDEQNDYALWCCGITHSKLWWICESCGLCTFRSVFEFTFFV